MVTKEQERHEEVPVTTRHHHPHHNKSNNNKDHRPKGTLLLLRCCLCLDHNKEHRVIMVLLHFSSIYSYTSSTFLLPTYSHCLLVGIGGVGIVLGMAPDGSFRPVPAAIAEQVLSSMSAAGAAGGRGGGIQRTTNTTAQRRNAISGPPSGNLFSNPFPWMR